MLAPGPSVTSLTPRQFNLLPALVAAAGAVGTVPRIARQFVAPVAMPYVARTRAARGGTDDVEALARHQPLLQ